MKVLYKQTGLGFARAIIRPVAPTINAPALPLLIFVMMLTGLSALVVALSSAMYFRRTEHVFADVACLRALPTRGE